MNRRSYRVSMDTLLASAKQLAESVDARGVVLLTDRPVDAEAVSSALDGLFVIVASDSEEVQKSLEEADIACVPLGHEPQPRQTQLAQALVESIADELLRSGDVVVCLYSMFERDHYDTISVIRLAEQLSRLTPRDLQRLETRVPLETLRAVVELACEIGSEGREGKAVGTLFVVGNHRKVLGHSHEQIHDPFRGYGKSERNLRNPRVRESIKEIAQMDGAFIISSDGVVMASGRHLQASAENLTLSKGLGSRHWAAAEISRAAQAIAVAVSESTGTVRIFQDGEVVLRIEPTGGNLKWTQPETDAGNETATHA